MILQLLPMFSQKCPLQFFSKVYDVQGRSHESVSHQSHIHRKQPFEIQRYDSFLNNFMVCSPREVVNGIARRFRRSSFPIIFAFKRNMVLQGKVDLKKLQNTSKSPPRKR